MAEVEFRESKFKKLFLIWLFLMAAGFFTAGCVYVAFQQTQRESANQQAAQIAKQVAWQMSQSNSIEAAIDATGHFGPNTPVVETDMTQAISPFVMIFDKDNQWIYSSTTPWYTGWKLPSGFFANIAKNGDNRATWQPEKNLRFATVGIKAHLFGAPDDYYVIGAYSLSESERASDDFAKILAVGSVFWAVGVALLLVVFDLLTKHTVIEIGRKSREK